MKLILRRKPITLDVYIRREFKINKVSIQPKKVERKIKMQRKRRKQRQHLIGITNGTE